MESKVKITPSSHLNTFELLILILEVMSQIETTFEDFSYATSF